MNEKLDPKPTLTRLTPDKAAQILARADMIVIDEPVIAILEQVRSGTLRPFEIEILYRANQDSDPDYAAALLRVKTYWKVWAGDDAR